VPALWTTRRFVCKRSYSLKFVTRHFIRHSLQRARVERARDSITPVCTTVEIRLKVHRRDRAVVLHARLDVHQHRMASTVTIEDFFARQRNLHRTSGNHRELANNDFMIERIAFAAKPTTVRRRDHTDVTRRQTEHLRERAMDVMRRLRRAPERDLSV